LLRVPGTLFLILQLASNIECCVLTLEAL
jgi:hypothetical protein